MNNLKNILFLAYEFPPIGGGGVQRSLFFAKYLMDFDIKPIVVTVEISEDQRKAHQIDYDLLKELPKDLIIERIKTSENLTLRYSKIRNWISLFFSIYERGYKYWAPNVYQNASGIIKKYKPKAIYVSIPYFGIAPIALNISKKYNLPLVVDFRDAWSQWRINPYGSIIHYLLTVRQERKLLKQAAVVVCTSEQTKTDLLDVHPMIDHKKINVITNGFKEFVNEDINEIVVDLNKEEFTIGYVGNFYYTPESRDNMLRPWYKKKLHRMLQFTPKKEDWLYRSPYYFFKALNILFKLYPEYINKTQVKFAGNKPYWIDDQIKEFGLENNCKFLGYLSHSEALDFQLNCDALLLTSSKVINGKAYSIAGKTFEYFSLLKPIIAFVPEGAQKDILFESGISIIFNPDNEFDNAIKLKKLINGEIKLNANFEYIKKFTRFRLTQELANLINPLFN